MYWVLKEGAGYEKCYIDPINVSNKQFTANNFNYTIRIYYLIFSSCFSECFRLGNSFYQPNKLKFGRLKGFKVVARIGNSARWITSVRKTIGIYDLINVKLDRQYFWAPNYEVYATNLTFKTTDRRCWKFITNNETMDKTRATN